MSPVSPACDISAAEFAERRRRAAAKAKAAGHLGLLVCGRGGGAVDRYGDITYLSNHYSSFPYIPDVEGKWTGRARFS